MKDVVKKLMGQIIVSCQAYEDTPLYGPENMKTMARSVLLGGAKAIRACWPQDIKAIRSLGDFPIVGINKVLDPNREDMDYVYITPTFESAVPVIEAGSDILALDCTIRPERGKEELRELLRRKHILTSPSWLTVKPWKMRYLRKAPAWLTSCQRPWPAFTGRSSILIQS